MSFESRTDYGGRIDFGAFRFVLYDRNAETKNACLSEAPCVSRAVLGKSDKVKLCKYPDHKGEHRAVRTDRAFTLKVSREVMEVFGVLVPVGAREYLPIFWITSYLK